MGSVALDRHVTLETVQVEVFATIDGQGKPSYDSEVDVEVRAVRQDKTIIAADGSEQRTELTLWIPASEAVQPDNRDRVTRSSVTFIVAEVKDVQDRSGTVAHRRVRCRRE